jgi:inorganic pyrophosphatase
VYKDLENKTVDVGGWGDVNEVRNHKNCTERFNQIENKPAGLFSIK